MKRKIHFLHNKIPACSFDKRVGFDSSDKYWKKVTCRDCERRKAIVPIKGIVVIELLKEYK